MDVGPGGLDNCPFLQKGRSTLFLEDLETVSCSFKKETYLKSLLNMKGKKS